MLTAPPPRAPPAPSPSRGSRHGCARGCPAPGASTAPGGGASNVTLGAGGRMYKNERRSARWGSEPAAVSQPPPTTAMYSMQQHRLSQLAQPPALARSPAAQNLGWRTPGCARSAPRRNALAKRWAVGRAAGFRTVPSRCIMASTAAGVGRPPLVVDHSDIDHDARHAPALLSLMMTASHAGTHRTA